MQLKSLPLFLSCLLRIVLANAEGHASHSCDSRKQSIMRLEMPRKALGLLRLY